MSTKKILTIIFSVLIIGAFAFLLTWGIINFEKVKEGMAGNGLYTQSDIQNAYEDGYNTALTDKDEYDDLMNEYRDTITSLTDNISQLNSEIATLTKSNNALELQIGNLTQLKNSLETQVETLTANKEINEATIADLNSQIVGLNTEISTLTLQVQNHNSVVNALNKTISDLQSSINYYEQYIASMETGNSVVTTFEFDGKVYNIQVVNKGSIVTVTNPSSTEYVTFNGWTVDGHPVNLAQYPVNANTKFVADVTYKYLVKFTVDGSERSRQTIQKDRYATLPATPTKTDYVFVGWTLDGINVVNVDTYAITEHTTFIAKFVKQSFVVQFTVDDTVHDSQTIDKDGYATLPATPNKDGYNFVGWTLDGSTEINVTTHKITQATTFIAKFAVASYDITFMVGDSVYNTQTVSPNSFATLPTVPKKDGYIFDFWTVDGTNKVDIESYAITQNTTFKAKFVTYTASKKEWNGFSTVLGDNIWTDGVNYYYSNSSWKSFQYVLDIETQTWSATTWGGYNDIIGKQVWTDGVNIYYSNSTKQYVLNIQTHTWSEMTWNGLTNFEGSFIWSDGTSYYYSSTSSQYVLEVNTHTWIKMTWKGFTSVNAYFVWTDGVNIYHSNSGTNYVLNVKTHTWSTVVFNNMPSYFSAYEVWTDGTNVFYSSGYNQYILNVETRTWSEMTWNENSSFNGQFIWTDGKNYYHSNSTNQYIMEKA